MLQRVVGPQVVAAAVLFGEVLDGAEAERVGLALRCVDDDARLKAPLRRWRHGRRAHRELAIETKRTIVAMAAIATHEEAVDREIEPQVWSTRQPWFEERIAALQAKISKKS